MTVLPSSSGSRNKRNKNQQAAAVTQSPAYCLVLKMEAVRSSETMVNL
jgi:hypothetical protein